jgi:RNA polymerase sigma-70 factor (ECF subfamily)
MTWPPELPFAHVLATARALDPSAVAQLYRRFLPVVYRYSLARVGDVHAAEDVTSETFIAMVEGITTTRAQEELAFAAWVLGIARNKVALHFRGLRRRAEERHELDDDVQPQAYADGGDPLDIMTARESWTEVVAALNLLTDEQRMVVLYRCVLGYAADDVARLMGKQAGTIRALQFRALASLARHLAVAGDARGAGGTGPQREPEQAPRGVRSRRRNDAARR